jgi:Rod binding domain-containing protein
MLDPLNGLNPKNQGPADRQALARVAVEAETIFMTQLLESLRRSMVQGLASPQSSQMRGYQALADQHLARALVMGGGLGLARRIFADLALTGC